MTRRAIYPGSFDPPTIAHLAIARAVLDQCQCDSLTFALSLHALGKDGRADTVPARHQALRTLINAEERLEVIATDKQLIADISQGFDVVVVGADKWAQIIDPVWYDNKPDARDAALAALPHVALAPRPPTPTPAEIDGRLTVLQLADPSLAAVSSTAVRNGRSEWLARPASQP